MDLLNQFLIFMHDYNTRSCTGLYARQPKTELGKFSISYRGPTLCNKILNDGIIPETSEAIFKKFLKKFITNDILWKWSSRRYCFNKQLIYIYIYIYI